MSDLTSVSSFAQLFIAFQRTLSHPKFNLTVLRKPSRMPISPRLRVAMTFLPHCPLMAKSSSSLSPLPQKQTTHLEPGPLSGHSASGHFARNSAQSRTSRSVRMGLLLSAPNQGTSLCVRAIPKAGLARH